MNKHTYLRAYMAGIMVPTLFLLVVMTVFCFVRYAYNLAVPIERVIVFPMAVVPNLWGVWNVLFVALCSRYNIPIGAHGAALPFLLAPAGFFVTRVLDFPIPHSVSGVFPVAFPIALVVYYLAWKYLVGQLNGVLGLA